MIKKKIMLVWELPGPMPTNKVEWGLGVYMRGTEKDNPGLGDLCLGDWTITVLPMGTEKTRLTKALIFFFMSKWISELLLV